MATDYLRCARSRTSRLRLWEGRGVPGRERPQRAPHTETITEPNGAVVVPPPKPKVYSTKPSHTCERRPYASANAGKTYVAPPMPGLSAKASGKDKVEVSWSFDEMPGDCRPVKLIVGLTTGTRPGRGLKMSSRPHRRVT